jgi:uncharacterized protein (TIGR03067 family)
MRRAIFVLLALVPADLVTDAEVNGQDKKPAASEVQGDLKEMQGRWIAETWQVNGRDAIKDLQQRKVRAAATLSGDRLAFDELGADSKVKTENDRYTIRLDPKADPKQITWTRERDRAEIKAIYELKGDTLRLSTPLEAGGPRPATFDGSKGSDQVLIILKRLKEKGTPK